MNEGTPYSFIDFAELVHVADDSPLVKVLGIGVWAKCELLLLFSLFNFFTFLLSPHLMAL